MQLGEAVKIMAGHGQGKEMCPFCQKDKHDFWSNEDTSKVKVVSKPKNLKCKMSNGKKPKVKESDASNNTFAYTLARHHLISAKQCYAQLEPLVRIGLAAKYDINGEHNGIGLPTTHRSLRYLTPEDNRTYGKLVNDEKERVSFSIMKKLGAQWHVGHHSFAYPTSFEEEKENSSSEEIWGDEIDEKKTAGHPTSYDAKVIGMLIDLMLSLIFSDQPVCEELKDQSDKIQKKLKEISKVIKDDLEKFSKDPTQSTFFVSKRAWDYANQLAGSNLESKNAKNKNVGSVNKGQTKNKTDRNAGLQF